MLSILFKNNRILIMLITLVILVLAGCAGFGQESTPKILACVKIDGKWGYIDKTGAVVISAQFDDAKCFSEGFACMKINSKWGYVDQAGTVVISAQFDDAFGFVEGLACVKINGK